MSEQRIVHLALTGGPDAATSATRAYLADQLTARGWRVLTAPDAAPTLPGDLDVLAAAGWDTYLAVASQLTGLARDLHARYTGIAVALGAPKTVVLHHRGLPEIAAHLSTAEYEQVLATQGLTAHQAHDLYDTVVHQRGPADDTVLACWSGHPHLALVAAHETAAATLERTLAVVLHALGDPAPVEAERKFALTAAPDLTHPVLAAAARSDIEQIYLPRVGAGEQRIRARTSAGTTRYTHAVKTDVGDGTRVEVETPIEKATYDLLAGLRDPATVPVRKTRHVFVVGDQRFELDHVTAPREAWLLEVELVDLDDPVEVPDFLPPAVEVTHDRAWRNRALADLTAP